MTAALDTVQAAIHAAETNPGVHIRAPRAGIAVMACECGRMLNRTDMTWSVKVRQAVVPRIVCADCQRNRAW